MLFDGVFDLGFIVQGISGVVEGGGVSGIQGRVVGLVCGVDLVISVCLN